MRPVAPVLIVAAWVFVLCNGQGAWAGPATDQLRLHVDQVLQVLQDPVLQKDSRPQERRAAIRRIASDIFDFTEITKRSLGRHWQGRTPAEQAEMVQLFTDLLERTYVSRIEAYSGEKVAFVGEALDGGVATVKTKIVGKQGTEIPIDYRMYRRGNQWLTYDVSIEGVSLVANYRTQFNAIITKSSYQELVKMMRAKEAEAASPPVARQEGLSPAAGGAAASQAARPAAPGRPTQAP